MLSFELVAIFTRLQVVATRAAAMKELAAFTKVSRILLFGKDDEIGVFLPAPGQPQTLRLGNQWQAFLAECARAGMARNGVPDPDNETDILATGMVDRFGASIMVFLGGEPDSSMQEAMLALLPLVGAKLAIERTALAAEGNAAAARSASQRAGALNAALDANRRELQAACENAERELVSRREAQARLKETDQRKDEFLAMLAHELRNPLAPVSMAAHILRLPSVDPARLRHTSEIIDRQIAHMTSLLDDLLDVSRVTRGLIVLGEEVLEVSGIIADAIEQTTPLIEARHQQLILKLAHGPVLVSGDRTRLVQILTNLLNNAAKYTPEGGTIELQLEVDQNDITLTICDSGVGIDARLLPRVFDLFTQAERSPDRSQGGLGLGLALVKSLVALHCGSVSAQSSGPGQGSQFSVCLPRLAERSIQPKLAQSSDPMPASVHKLRVLIVDDNADAAQTLGMILEAAGYQVEVAFNAKTAIQLAQGSAPQLLVLDIGLPDIDGNELARRLRLLPQTARSSFIALTGYGQPEDRARCLSAGFDYHLTKPADATKLLKLLQEISL